MLVIDQLSKAFGGLAALDNVSFQVNKAEIVGVIGPNGAGKTTLFGVISGFHRPTSGRVLFGGERIDGLKPHEVCRRGIGRTFQASQVFPSFSAYQTVLLAALHSLSMRQAREKAEEVLEFAGLLPKASQNAASLTLPDQKALEFAKALALQPQLLLLDEIMAGLTEAESQAAVSRVRRLRDQGMTFLVVEHRMEIIMGLCDRIVALNFGSKIAEGTPREVAINQDVIESYFGEKFTFA